MVQAVALRSGHPDQDTDDRLRGLIDARRFQQAATEAIQAYGPELHAFVRMLVRHTTDTDEVFAQACADLWDGIDRFRCETTFRSWIYIIARNAYCRHRRAETSQRARVERFKASDPSRAIVAECRTTTQPFLRTDVKDRIARLRERLETADQMILVLRVDRDFSWEEVARVVHGIDESCEADDLRRRAAACRKRFERTVKKLRELAARDGLLARVSG